MSGLPSNNIPRSFIDDVLQKTDIIELIDAHVPLKKNGHHHVACCPFHQEKSPSFKVHGKNQFYHCFGCGASGNAISFIMNYLHLNFVETIQNLADRVGLTLPNDSQQKHIAFTPLFEALNQVSTYYQKSLKTSQCAIQYLKQRGITGDIARKFSLGYAPPEWHDLEQKFPSQKQALIDSGSIIQKKNNKCYDRFRHRLMFPIHNKKGKIIGFGGRALSAEDTPKYLNSPESVIFQKGHELYGLYQATQQPSPTIIIVEGYMDVIALAQHGYTNAVATLGTANSPYHIQLLSKHAQKLYFCFDGDAAGQKAAWRALENSLSSLNMGLEIFFVILPEEHDPDSLIRSQGKGAFDAYLSKAKPLQQFFLDYLTATIDISSLAGKTQLVNAAKPYLQKIPEGVYKHWLSNEIARITHVSQNLLLNITVEKKPTPPSNIAFKRTPLRTAIAILIQHPDIYVPYINQFNPDLFRHPQQVLLKQLLSLILQNPTINTAYLIEHFRDSEYFEALNKLAAWNPNVPNEALAQEWVDTMNFLLQENIKIQIQQLLQKSRTDGLTIEEQRLLQIQLQAKQKITPPI